MKTNKVAALLLAASLCAMTAGCTASNQEESEMPVVSPSAAVSQKPTQSGFANGNTGVVGSQSVTLNAPQKQRITYQQGANNSVTFISSVDQLSAYQALAGDKLDAYDKDFFNDKALVLVKYTVNSGSTQVSLDSANRVSNVVSVHVDAQPSGDMGTTDMATWLMWAEVDKSLGECQWVLDGASGTGTGVTQ